MANIEFKFIESYRTMLPTAPVEVVEARQKGHDKLYPAITGMNKVYELCRLAFLLPQDFTSLVDWFQKAIREFDPQFSLEVDTAEAGRIASLLLRDLISRGSPQSALAVLVASFCGQRSSVDEKLLVIARDAVTEAGRARRIVLGEKKIAAPTPKDFKADLDTAIQPAWNQATLRTGIEAMITDARDGLSKVAASANDAHQLLWGDVVRLAEEVDMLWWYVGDWTEILHKPRGSLPDDTLAIASGIEIGDMVRKTPGPYGTYGVLRRSVAKIGDRKAKIKNVVGAIAPEDVKNLAQNVPKSAMNVFPVHAALRLSADLGAGAWPAAFDLAVKGLSDAEVTYYELAVQAFRERVLIKHGGLE